MSQSAHSNPQKQPPVPGLRLDPPGFPRTRQKFKHPSRPPPVFWDNLSEVPLIRSAVRELNRRNALSEDKRRPRRGSRQTTQNTSNNSRCKQPATDKPQDHDLQTRLERFARQGGPDLTDLRGVGVPVAQPGPLKSLISHVASFITTRQLWQITLV